MLFGRRMMVSRDKTEVSLWSQNWRENGSELNNNKSTGSIGKLGKILWLVCNLFRWNSGSLGLEPVDFLSGEHNT